MSKSPRGTKSPNIITSTGVGWKQAPPKSSGTRFGQGKFGEGSFGAAVESHGLPPILLGAIVQESEPSESGSLVVSLRPAWEAVMEIATSNPEALLHLSPRQWEEVVAASYERAGFDKVTLTPSSGDYGRDVIAIKRGLFSVRIIDQVKAYKPGHLVRADEVRALLGVLAGEQNASKGVVTTTSDFAPKIKEDPFIAPFLPYRLQLVNNEELIKRLNDLSS